MDQIDRKILDILQKDATKPIAEIAEAVGLSSTPCWRRIQNLEADGVIKQRVALCDASKLDVGTTVFVSIKTNQHNPDWLEQFANAVQDFPRSGRVLSHGW